jgi:hypothetical protein
MNIEKINLSNLQIPEIIDYNAIPKGDMPGDKIKIEEGHVKKAQTIFPKLLEKLDAIFNTQPNCKAVISVHGGSGVGKSEIGSLLAYYLNDRKVGAYILSGDNYPHRIPKFNDRERLRVFREYGIKGLVDKGEYTKANCEILKTLQLEEKDYDPQLNIEYPWLSVYQSAGAEGLKNYLGTPNEIDFAEMNHIIEDFKSGQSSIMLKRMGREEQELWYDKIDMTHIDVLVIEWTHGNNSNLEGVDIPILLNSTPQETLEHRRSRNRDGNTDSPFITMVLGLEQELLQSQAKNAEIIVMKNGDIISYDKYL